MILTTNELQSVIIINVNNIISQLNAINISNDNTGIILNINNSLTRIQEILNPVNNV